MKIGFYIKYFSGIYHGLVWVNGQYFDSIVFLAYQKALPLNRKIGFMDEDLKAMKLEFISWI